MSYKLTRRGVSYLINNELDMACNEHGEVFASMHEGESVIREEVDEAIEEIRAVCDDIKQMWECIKEEDAKEAKFMAADIADDGERLACEAIQIAAMAHKFIETVCRMEGEDGRED